MQGFRYLENVTTLKLDVESCSGCGLCVEVCPHQVFAMQDGLAAVVDKDACMECGACAKNCDSGALSVDAGVGCAGGLIAEWWQDVTGRRKKAACCG
ncbi:MAG: 4Fe-4S binding protein [Deltaproteobacteria bacterium]|nr:4Fe-4S binding protein [Deltaproteobacteria bacterium]